MFYSCNFFLERLVITHITSSYTNSKFKNSLYVVTMFSGNKAVTISIAIVKKKKKKLNVRENGVKIKC